jgi:para-aminobenzoate synthetase component 1
MSEAFIPLVYELDPRLRPVEAFRRLCGLPHCLFLDSALEEPQLGRYSFVAADPFDFLCAPADGSDSLSVLARKLASLAPFGPAGDDDSLSDAPINRGALPRLACSVDGLPPFQGGVAGLFGYELGRGLEQAPPPRYDEFRVPALAVGFYDVVVAFDHIAGRGWLISQGLPETAPHRRLARAAVRGAEFREHLLRSPSSRRAAASSRPSLPALLAPRLAPQYPVGGIAGLTSNFSREDYLRAVERVIEYILAGDVFQVNLAQRLLFPANDDSVSLYLRLRERNPAPFAAYFDLGDYQVLSTSPERFLKVSQGQVETRPIKGTRRRTGQPAADRQLAAELAASEKDRAENVMICDLLRNDLSRVCRPDSVRVADLCRLETYQCVFHLVSVVVGELRADRSGLDLLRGAFPGGSITGAPKVRAMEIIAELEPTARGAYCGSLGYLGFDGTMDLNILIRTVTAGRGWWQFGVGGGLVAQSNPQQEYQETWDKAAGILRALEQ